MRFRERRDKWCRSDYRGKKNGIEIIVDFANGRGWYFYGGGHNSLGSEVGAFKTKEEAFEAAEKWCTSRPKASGTTE